MPQNAAPDQGLLCIKFTAISIKNDTKFTGESMDEVNCLGGLTCPGKVWPN